MSSEDAKKKANSPKYVPKQVARRTLKSGAKTLRAMDIKPLPTRRPSQDARREWLLKTQPRRYLNTMVRNVKEIGKILGKVVEKENFVQVLADFLYRCPDGIIQVSNEAPPLPTTLPPDSSGTSTVNVDTEVLAKWDDGKYYKAIVEKKMKNGFLVRYKDYAEFKEVTKEEIRLIEQPMKRNSFSVKEFAKDMDYKFDQGLLAGAPSDRKSVINASGAVATGKACAVSECTAFRMAGFPYCQAHQSELSLGVFDSSKVLTNKAPKKSVFAGPIKPPSGPKGHFATMPVDMSKMVVERNESNKRQRVREEILSTERTYYRAIAIVMTSYVNPLRMRTSEDRNFLDSNKVSDLISNWETLASFHQAFLQDLEMTDNIPKIFIKYAVYFKLYTHYLNGYDKCLQALDELRSHKKFSVFMAEVSANFRNKGKLDLMSYLIMPVQRVPRYVMLLRELKKHTPADHPHSDELGNAIEKVAEVAKHVNESKRKAENLSVLYRIFQKISGLNEESSGLVLMQPYRQFIREGMMIESKSGGAFTTLKETTRIFYLFNDILLWTTEKHKYKGWLNLSASKVSHGPEKNGMQDWISVETSKICLLFKAVSGTEETERWKVDLLKAIDRRNQLRKEKMNKRRNRVLKRANLKKATLKVKGSDDNQAHSVIASGLATLKQQNEARASLSRNNSVSLISTNSMSITVNDDGNSPHSQSRSPLTRSPIGHTIPSPLARSKSGLGSSKGSPRQVKRRQLRSTGQELNRPLTKNPLPESTEGPDQ